LRSPATFFHPTPSSGLGDRFRDVEWLSVPEDSYVAIAGVKLTGRMNFDCAAYNARRG